jgi:endonuclease/exonuclease/phosphatase family metal-dependent hydrolase
MVKRWGIIVAIILSLSTAGWSQGRDGGKREVDIATVNLYVGADFTPIVTLDPSSPGFQAQLVAAVATVYLRIVASNFEKRADALAQQIVDRGPDLVALQEVSLIRRQSPGDIVLGGTTPATNVELDYLAILLAAIERHGGHYAAVSQDQDADVEVPLITPTGGFDDIRLTDRDVILMRTDLPPGHLRVSNAANANYVARVPLPIGVSVLRGWCSVDVETRGRSFRFINTHLEDRLPPPAPNVQAGQAIELMMGPANTTLPVVLAGDFNSDAYGNYSPVTYPLLLSQGMFSDAWTVAGEGLGLTWGHDEFLANPAVPFIYRLDLVLYRGSNFKATDAEVADPLIGAPPPLWFSDHGAVFVKLSIN